MILLAALFGLLSAYLLHRGAEWLPRLAGHDSPARRPGWQPALVEMLLARGDCRLISTWQLIDAALELALPLVYIWLWSRLGAGLDLALTLLALLYFALVALIDLRQRLVLNLLTYPALLIALLLAFSLGREALLSKLLGGVLAFGIFFLTSLLKPGTLGGGDIKLAALVGLLLGFPNLLYALLIGAGLGAFVALALLLLKRQAASLTIPYAPFLSAGALAWMLISIPSWPFLT